MATSPSSFEIERVDHTGITVTSLHDALEFWVDVLGFKHLYTRRFPNDPFIENVVGVPGAALTLAMVEAAGHSIELLEYHAPDNRAVMRPPPSLDREPTAGPPRCASSSPGSGTGGRSLRTA